MNVQDIIDLSHDLTHTNDGQISDTQVLKYLNLVKDNFWSYIVSSVNEDYDWEKWNTSLINGQVEYQIPEVASDKAGAKKLKGVSICYDGRTYNNGALIYQKAREVQEEALEKDWNYYVNNQPQDKPIYYLSDKSIFIAPAPTQTVSLGIELRGIKKIKDYSLTTTEADIKIPSDYFEVLIQGILPYIYRNQGDLQRANVEKAEYERLREQAIFNMSDRISSPFINVYPDSAIDKAF